LVDVFGVVDVVATVKWKITYHPSCHMTLSLGVKAASLTVLQNVKGAELVVIPIKDDCCGFGGTFAGKETAISTAMSAEKSQHVAKTGAEYLVGGDMACLANIGGRMTREGKSIKIAHVTEILNHYWKGEI